MLVVMQSHSTPAQIERVLETIRQMGLTPHPMPGPTRTAIGITGNTSTVDPRALEVMPGVLELIRVTKPYKLASREMHEHDTVVRLPQGTFGERQFTIIAGPCSVEDEAMILRTADWLLRHGVRFLRAGAFKPRTSPYAFQGLGLEGLEILRRVGEKTGIGIVTELMDTENADAVEAVADVIQIGARNMQNFTPAAARCAGATAGVAQARNVGDAGGMADVGRVFALRRQSRRDPLRARGPDLLRS